MFHRESCPFSVMPEIRLSLVLINIKAVWSRNILDNFSNDQLGLRTELKTNIEKPKRGGMGKLEQIRTDCFQINVT